MEHEMIISNIISRRDKWNGTWDDHTEIISRRDKWNGTWDDHIEYN